MPETEVPVRALGTVILAAVGAWAGSWGGIVGALGGLYTGFSLGSKLIAPVLPEKYEIRKYASPHHIFKDIYPTPEEKSTGSKHQWLFKDL